MGSYPPSIPSLAGWRCTRNDDGLQRQADRVRGGEWEVYQFGCAGSGEIMSGEKVRICQLCIEDHSGWEVSTVNENDLYYCVNCGFVNVEDTIRLHVVEVDDETD